MFQINAFFPDGAGSGIWEIIYGQGERRRSKEWSNKLPNFYSLPASKFPKERNKNEDKTKLEPWDLGAPEKDPVDLFSARKFPKIQQLKWSEAMHVS